MAGRAPLTASVARCVLVHILLSAGKHAVGSSLWRVAGGGASGSQALVSCIYQMKLQAILLYVWLFAPCVGGTHTLNLFTADSCNLHLAGNRRACSPRQFPGIGHSVCSLRAFASCTHSIRMARSFALANPYPRGAGYAAKLCATCRHGSWDQAEFLASSQRCSCAPRNLLEETAISQIAKSKK